MLLREKAGKGLLCCSEKSLMSWWVWQEIDIALDLEREQQEEGQKEESNVLLPLDLDGYVMSSQFKTSNQFATRKPYVRIIRQRCAFGFNGWRSAALPDQRFEGEFDRVASAVKRG